MKNHRVAMVSKPVVVIRRQSSRNGVQTGCGNSKAVDSQWCPNWLLLFEGSDICGLPQGILNMNKKQISP